MTREDQIKKAAEIIAYGCSDELKAALIQDFPELAESEDERIRKWLYDYFKTIGSTSWLHEKDMPHEQILAYLEKQKEEEGYEAIPIENTLEYKAGFHAGREFEKQKEQKPNFDTHWENGSMVCEQKEQKPVECIPDSVKFDEGFKTGREIGFHEGVESVKPVEWSEEDEEMLQGCINSVEYELLDNGMDDEVKTDPRIAWLKSLRPQKLDASKLENFDPVDVLNRIKTEWPMAWEKVVGKQEWSEEDEEKIKDIIDYLECWNDFDHRLRRLAAL